MSKRSSNKKIKQSLNAIILRGVKFYWIGHKTEIFACRDLQDVLIMADTYCYTWGHNYVKDNAEYGLIDPWLMVDVADEFGVKPDQSPLISCFLSEQVAGERSVPRIITSCFWN